MSNPEFYPTPSWTTYAILAREPMEGSILEPACGKGDISKIVDAGAYAWFVWDKEYKGPTTCAVI